MNVAEFVIGQIALLAWREMKRLSPGCRPAALGIAHVIRNRVDAAWQGGDWLRILQEVPVHSAEEIIQHDWISLPDVYDKDFLWLHPEVSRLYQDRGCPDNITSSADITWAAHEATKPRLPRKKGLFYCNLQMPIRPWFLENIIRRPSEHPATATAGTINFYA